MIEEKLHRIYQDVNESMRFAEAKNAALVTFNGAALYVLIEGRDYLPTLVQDRINILSAILIIGITISIIAFLPNMNPSYKRATKVGLKEWTLRKDFSIFYFGHIRLYDAEEFLAKVYTQYNEVLEEPLPKAELDLARQTIIVSQITRHKYVFFSIAGHLTLIALILPIPFLLLYWMAILLRRLFVSDIPV